MKFNERIKYLREKGNITQKDMAEILEVSKSTYVKYERGEREPRYGVLLALSKYFDTSIDFILGNSDEENQYIDKINDITKFVLGEEFAKGMGRNKKDIQKLLTDFMHIIPLLSDLPEYLDMLFVLTKIEKKFINLHSSGRHIFMYEEWAFEDIEYKEVVGEPNTGDITEFIQLTSEIRNLIDSYINTLSSKEYYSNTQLKYENEINNYEKLERNQQLEQILSHELYKSRKTYKF